MVPAAAPQRRVALVSDAASFGGAEIYLASLVAALSQDHDFVALLPEGADAAADRLQRAGAPSRRIRDLARIPRPVALLSLHRALRAQRPALVHVNATDQADGLTAILAARALRLPIVVTVHLGLQDRSAAYERLAGWALRRATTVIAVSDGVGRHLAGLGVQATVITNGVPVPVAAPGARGRLGATSDALLVAGIGRLTEQKGWDVLCAAAPRLRERYSTADVVIVGDGPERGRLEGLAAAGGVRLLGASADASTLLCGVDILAAPSRFEGLPLILMEALHAGVPVVASDIPGTRDVLGDCGVLVRPDDPQALGDALGRLALDAGWRHSLAASGRQRAAERFTIGRMATETADAYGASLRMSA